MHIDLYPLPTTAVTTTSSEVVKLKVLRTAMLGDQMVRVVQESGGNNPYVTFVTADGKIGWALPQNIW